MKNLPYLDTLNLILNLFHDRCRSRFLVHDPRTGMTDVVLDRGAQRESVAADGLDRLETETGLSIDYAAFFARFGRPGIARLRLLGLDPSSPHAVALRLNPATGETSVRELPNFRLPLLLLRGTGYAVTRARKRRGTCPAPRLSTALRERCSKLRDAIEPLHHLRYVMWTPRELKLVVGLVRRGRLNIRHEWVVEQATAILSLPLRDWDWRKRLNAEGCATRLFLQESSLETLGSDPWIIYFAKRKKV